VAADGTIRWSVNLSWNDLPLGSILAARYGLPTIVANDSRAAALATFLFEGDERPDNLVAIKVGRGIGAGLVLNGELFGGDGDGAGEIGHIVVEPDGAECHCGRFGCLETLASAPAILQAAERAGLQARSLAALAAAADAGDDAALAVVRGAGRALGQAVANLTGILDVRRIVVHGSVTALGDPWLNAIRDEATRRSLGPLARETRIVDGGVGDDLTLLGACALLLTRELGLTVHR
jgi:predicted NBD/HSP70 family sugar kinase